MSLASKAFTHNLHVRGTKLTASCDLACATQGLDPPTVYSDLITHHDWPVKNTIGDCQSV